MGRASETRIIHYMGCCKFAPFASAAATTGGAVRGRNTGFLILSYQVHTHEKGVA